MLLWLIGKKKTDNEKVKTEKVETEKVETNTNSMIYSNISELPSKNILNEEQNLENKILDNSIQDEQKNKDLDKDDIINKFGFETIF